MALEDYKDIVGAAAGFVTFCQMFSGIFLCKDIYKKGSTHNIPYMPFVGGLVLSILFYQNGLLINDSAMTSTNLLGTALNIFYVIFYYLWTDKNKRSNFNKALLKATALIVGLLCYVGIENPEKVVFRFGLIITVLLLLFVTLPLLSLGEVIRTRSTETLPFPIIFSGFLVSAHWLLYGFIIRNTFVIFQNLFVSAICLVQLMLFVIYPSSTTSKTKKEE